MDLEGSCKAAMTEAVPMEEAEENKPCSQQIVRGQEA